MKVTGQVRLTEQGAAFGGHGETGHWSGKEKMARSGLQKVKTKEVTSQMRIRRPEAASMQGASVR